MKATQLERTAFSLLELLAAATVIGVVAVVMVPRLTGGSEASKHAACAVHRGNIEIQAELWRHNKGAWPAANLSDVGADPTYFPEGVPICPVDETSFPLFPR